MVQGPGVDSGRDLPAGSFSTPRFLAAQRSAVSSRREEIAVVALAAQHNTRVCGPLCDPSGSSQAIPSLSSASTVFASTLALDLQLHSSLQDHSTIRLPSSKPTVFRRRKAFLLCKNPCGGTARAKKFPEEICFAPSRVLANLSYPRRLSAQKYVTTPDWENLCTGQPRGARGTAVPLFREESRGTPSKGFLWATSSWTARRRSSLRS